MDFKALFVSLINTHLPTSTHFNSFQSISMTVSRVTPASPQPTSIRIFQSPPTSIRIFQSPPTSTRFNQLQLISTTHPEYNHNCKMLCQYLFNIGTRKVKNIFLLILCQNLLLLEAKNNVCGLFYCRNIMWKFI